MYYSDFSEILQRGQQAIDKIEEVMDILAGNSEALDYVILKGRLIDSKLKVIDPLLYDAFVRVIENTVNKAVGSYELIDEDETDYDTIVQRCNAYYGDGGHLAHMFRNAGKPVMIQNYDVR